MFAMSSVAIIPARGGSQGVPGKNLRRVGGVSLLERAVRAARTARQVDEVYVSTDDSDIAYAAELAGAEVIIRPAELADDCASSESALLHALDQLEHVGKSPRVLTFIQCTSPFIDPDTIDHGVELILTDQADSTFAAVVTHEFLWRSLPGDGPALVAGQNHNAAFRPRRQDRQPDYRETGAFYVMSAAAFRTSRHRFFGRVAPVAVNAATAVDIDTEDDLVVANALTGLHPSPAADLDVDVVFTDFDGVHTDDAATIDEHGREAVRVSRADGLGVQRLREIGVPLVIISKETNPVVSARAAKLRAQVQQGIDDKVGAVRGWLEQHRIPAARAAYLGNDVNDAGPMSLVGWPVAVADARPEILGLARLRLTQPGGRGAVRELCDLVVEHRARGTTSVAVRVPQSVGVLRPAERAAEAVAADWFASSWS
jgi:N-acylneuraminate cytidylyltransferase